MAQAKSSTPKKDLPEWEVIERITQSHLETYFRLYRGYEEKIADMLESGWYNLYRLGAVCRAAIEAGMAITSNADVDTWEFSDVRARGNEVMEKVNSALVIDPN